MPLRKADLSKLLLQQPASYYWLGFLFADGHFYTKKNAIKLLLGRQDYDHFCRYAEFVGYHKKPKTTCLVLQNKFVVPKLVERFSIEDRKTEVPCNFDDVRGDLLFSLIVGYIDGDGSISVRNGRGYSIDVKVHKSWYDNLAMFENFIYKYFGRSKDKSFTRETKKGYARLVISDRSILGLVKKRALELGLPLMSRKWEPVDEAILVNQVEFYKERQRIIDKLLKEGLSRRQIQERLNMTKGALTMVLRRRCG